MRKLGQKPPRWNPRGVLWRIGSGTTPLSDLRKGQVKAVKYRFLNQGKRVEKRLNDQLARGKDRFENQRMRIKRNLGQS